MKKTLALILTLALLAGCGAAPAAETETEPPSPAQTGEAVSAPTPTPADPDFVLAYGRYAPDTPVLSIDGVEIDWEIYYDILYQYFYTLYAYYNVTDFNLQEEEDGGTAAEWVRERTETILREFALYYTVAAERGLAPDAEDTAAIDAEIQAEADYYYGGDRAALDAEVGNSEELLRFELGANAMFDKAFFDYFGEEGVKLSDEDALNFVTDSGYLYVKRILLKTVDSGGNALDAKTAAEKLALAEDLLAQLRESGEDTREALFDTLSRTHNEDAGAALYPDGIYFLPEDMPAEITEAAAALREGEVSEIIESSYGYSILYRPPMRADHVFDTDSEGNAWSVRYFAALSLFGNILDERRETQELVYYGEFGNLDVASLFY